MATANRNPEVERRVTPGGVRVKGHSFMSVLGGLRDLRGADAVTKAIARMPRDLQELLGSGAVIASGWYTIDSYRDLVQAVKDSQDGSLEFMRALSRHNTLRDFRGIYRLLCFVLTPESLVKRVPLLYGRYREGGAVKVLSGEATRVELGFSGCRGFDAVCWTEMVGGAEAVLEACGAKGIVSTILQGGGDHDDGMRVELRWRG